MSYNKETDYQSKINEAVEKGDYESAAKYEQSRNEKIDAEGLDYKKTNRYSGWLDKTDYSEVLKKQMSTGASRKEVSDTLGTRIRKASGTDGLTQYAADDVYDRAIAYIMGGSSYTEKKPEYKSSYDDDIEKLYRELSEVKKFSYNPYDDDLYEYYRKQYIREGNRAMEDLLGELSMNTGGIASSYAASAAAQSLNYYNEKLSDIIPELYDDAYGKYLDGISRKEKNLEILTDLRNDEYEKYLDSIDIFNDDRDFEYKQSRDAYEDSVKEENTALEYGYLYQKLKNEAEENSRKWEQQEYENEEKRKQDKIETALSKWEKMGYLDSESAEILGLSEGLHTTDYDYKTAQQYKLYRK